MNETDNNRVLVLGSNSFSGAHFVRLVLEKGLEVTGISRSDQPAPEFLPYRWDGAENIDRFSFCKMDLNHDIDDIFECINNFQPGYIVNFSAQGMVSQSWENPDHWIQTNTLSMIKLFDRLKGCSFLKKYVHISTPEVYGSVSGEVKENTVYSPSTPYAVSKAAADMSLMAYMKTYGFPVVFTRAANVFGPGQQLYRIVPRSILYFLTGRKLQLHGGGTSQRSFIHIRDVVQGTYQAMVKGLPGDIFHFSTTRMISIKELVAEIAQLMDISFEDHVESVDELKGKDFSYSLDASLAGERLGWGSEFSLEQGLEQTIDWVKQNLEYLKLQPFEYIHKP